MKTVAEEAGFALAPGTTKPKVVASSTTLRCRNGCEHVAVTIYEGKDKVDVQLDTARKFTTLEYESYGDFVNAVSALATIAQAIREKRADE